MAKKPKKKPSKKGVTKRTSEKILGQLSKSKFRIPDALKKR